MNVKNCRKCGRLFNYAVGPYICPQCREALEDKFKEVKAYIQAHPMCGIREVSEQCDVEPSQIQQWIREERLQFAEESAIMLNCESCGAPIRSGRYCDSCKAQLANGFSASIAKPKAPIPEPAKRDKESPKMRFLN